MESRKAAILQLKFWRLTTQLAIKIAYYTMLQDLCCWWALLKS
jgi:hypothetical protein